MLKSILTLGTGIVLGCYYKSQKDKNKLSNEKNNDDIHLGNDVKGKKTLGKLFKVIKKRSP